MKKSSMSVIGRLLIVLALLLQAHNARAAATLLPNGEQCFSATTGTNGMVGALGTITGGTGGTAGTYAGVALTGGSGSGATANITVSGGAVTTVVILNPGTQYVAGDTLSALSANIGSVVGFSVPVASVAINSSLAGGSVAMYVPSTTTFKQTWQNAAQTILNANPVPLNQNGCAIIYGTGSYRQVLMDSLGNTIWDQVTADTSSFNNTFWAGQASGTTNAITIVDAGFNATDGSIINFIPLFTNTGATTLNPSGFGNVSIVKDTTAGPVALTGGEIIATGGGTPNVVSVIYSATQNNFHLLNTVIASASGATAPLCGASGLKITNGGTPNSIISLTADQVVMQTTAGLTINRSSVSLTNINITTGNATATANGMDGEAPGLSAWLDIFAIDNGAAPAGLVSLAAGNGKSPTMPSGYTYKCYLGAMRVDGSGNLLRTMQLGQEASYTVVAASNVPNLPSIITGVSGAPTVPTWTSTSISALVPPTAAKLFAVISTTETGATSNVIFAPNNAYGNSTSTTNPPPCAYGSSLAAGSQFFRFGCSFNLESTNVFYAADLAAMAVFAQGWKDKVNAN